jgi:hypothetical protein
MRKLLSEIGIQNTAKQALKPLLDLKPETLAKVFAIIRQELGVTLDSRVNSLGKEELIILGALKHG